MSLSESAAADRIMSNQRHMLEEVILPALGSSAAKLDALASDAVAIVSSVFMLAAPIVAEKRGIPLVGVVFQPMAMLSAYDPPHTPLFSFMRHGSVGALGAHWNQALYGAMRKVLDLRYGRRIDQVRVEHGLALVGGRSMLESGRTAALTLCCYDPVFGPLQCDAPQNARAIGLPVFDVRSDADRSLSPDLERFLDSGPPPVVFTLGSFAIHSAGAFYAEATKAARMLNARAVLLTGSGDQEVIDGPIFTAPYARHSLLFPRACAIVHHGGVGTTGQALLAGKPQLVVPHMGDQYDNAHRVERIGVGRSLPARRFTAECAAPLLNELLENRALGARASHIALVSVGRDPACCAANAITELIESSITSRDIQELALPNDGVSKLV
jgi:rhamnosyltransferase subunit B